MYGIPEYPAIVSAADDFVDDNTEAAGREIFLYLSEQRRESSGIFDFVSWPAALCGTPPPRPR